MDRADNYAYYLDDSYANVVVVESMLLDKLEPTLAARPGLHVLVANGDPRGHTSFDEVVAGFDDELPAPAATHPDDMAFWLYSSGSTGRPKGVVHRQADIGATMRDLRRLRARTHRGRRHATRRRSCSTPTASATASSSPLGRRHDRPHAPGGPAPRRSSPPSRRDRPTPFFSRARRSTTPSSTPTGAKERDFSSVRICLSAAEPLPPEVFRRFEETWGLPILDGIGSTEMLHIYCSNTRRGLQPGSSGPARAGLRADDPATRTGGPPRRARWATCWSRATAPCRATGTTGSGPAAPLVGEWFATGDRYRCDDDGFYWYEGRADDMIKVGGLWVSPIEIEACLVRHPAVSEAAVIGVSVDDVSRIKAYVICGGRAGRRRRAGRELRGWCKEHLRRYEYPHVVEFVDDFPRTVTGKIQRFKLREAASRETQPA